MGDLIKQFEVILSKMLHDILGHIQRHSPLIRHFTKSWLVTELDFITGFNIITKLRKVPIEHFVRCAVSQARTLTPGHETVLS